MIAEFLKGEATSKRFGGKITREMKRLHMTTSMVANPDTSNKQHNYFRRRLLGSTRGFGQNQGIFTHFPTQLDWHLASLTPTELAEVLYINYDYWLELSNGSRQPSDAAANIRLGKTVLDQSNSQFLKAAHAIDSGVALTKLILVATNDRAPLVVLEGHLRLTAYFLANKKLSGPQEVIIGLSPELINWDLY